MQTDILGYGKQSAYARVPEYATVAAVTREDLLQWHKQHTTPNNIIFGVVGDFDSKEMEATLRKAFGDWPKGEKVEEPKVAIAPAKPGIYLVDKSDVNQSEIRMIGLGIERRNPDYFALQVMNEIFGGGFSSRLFINLRTKAGLAYAVGGGVGSGWDHPGLTILEIGTKTETTVEAIKGLWEQVDLLKKEPPSEVEMKRAKDADPEFVHLQLRYACQGSARAGDLRVLRLPERLPRTISRGGGEGDRGRRSASGQQVHPQGGVEGAGGGQRRRV